MKRTLALVLALIMILCMVPASMLTAFARGRGVYANNIPNQTIPNAPGQFIPETVVVDGVMDDTAWKEDDWKRVNSDSGTWSVQYPVTKNETFAYKYNVKKDYYYLYGAFVVPTSETGLVKLWLNNDAEAANRYTHVFTFDITGQMSGDKASSGNGTWLRETSTGIKVTDKSSYYYEKSKVVFVQDGDYTNIEFKVLLADFCGAPNPSIDYFAEVEASNDESLWHPMIEIDETFERSEWFPSMSGNWKSQFAGKITSADLNGLGKHSFLGDIDINGEFDEAEWAQHTDFYSRWYERTNVVDYKDNVNFLKPYSDLVYNKSFWNATSNSSAEHDLRVSKNYIHGAAVISVPAATTTNNIRFNMFHKLDNGDIWQATVYLHSTAGNTIDAAQFTFYVNGANPLTYTADMSTSEYVYSSATDSTGTPIFQAGTKVIGSPGMYSFEFRISRAFGPDFAPTVYDFCMAPNDSARYWSCDNRYDGTDLSDYVGDHPIQHHPNYTEDSANLKQAYYPITHYNNQFGLDDIGATDAKPEYYDPYTLYTPDGYLGVKSWPGLTFSAGGPCNSDFVNSTNSTRLQNLNYLHSLRADYEFVYGALSIQAEADSPFKNWIHGTETSPAGGDYFTLWVMVPDETGTLYRFDVWTYLDGNEVKAQIAGVDGNGNYVIEPETGAKAAFVNREKDPTKDRYYALEYQIALSSVGKKLDTSITTVEQVADYLSTPIFEYYTSLSVANDEKNAYGSMIWPKSGNGNLMPGDDGFYWNKEDDSNGIYGNPQILRYQDVIRVVEPDGRIVEELRFDLDDINFTDSEYRDISKDGNYFTAKEQFYVGRDYAYLGAEIDGNLSSYNTKVTLWIKKNDGTIHNYEFGHNGANATLKYDGIPVSGTTYVDQYGMTSTNGRTYFEAVIDMDRFGADDGFEYFIEITQRVNGENISRVFSDGTKILLPAIDFASQLNGVKAWYQTAGHVEDLVHFPREEITVDGNLGDNGWDPGEWKYVSTDINANLQEADTHKDAFKTDFYYQLRVDDEYLYVAAVIFYSDCTLAANTANITASQPSFRIWLKSGENGKNVQAGNSETYTDYYGMSMDANGNLKFGSAKNVMPTYANNTRQLYNKYYVPVVPAKDANGNYITENGKIQYTYDAKGMDTIYHRSATDTKYPSHLFGYTQYIVNEQEANKNANESVVLKGEAINPEDYEKENMLDHSKTQYNVERGIMRFGSDTNYNQQFNHGRTETLGEDSMVVEFKVKLDEFGGKDQFQYLVTTSATNSWGGTRTTMYPAITSESGSRDNYFHYYYPYWHWVDDTAVTVTDEVRADMTLLTYKRPVITLGAKVSKTYMYQGQETNALRMGGLWEEKYIRETKELVANNGYWPDKNGKPNWVDYWDVKAMGMVVIPTYLLKQNTKINADRPGIYDLFKGTANSVWMDADGIVGWAGNDETKYPNNNYADYKNFAFYVTVVNVPANVNFCFRGFVDYYDEVLNQCPSYYDVILERSIDMVIDSAIRTDSDESNEEDNALPGGGFSRDDESGWTGTDGSDYENSTDDSGDVSDDVSDDVPNPGITVEKEGASLDIAWPTNYNGTATGKYPNSLVFADNVGYGYKVNGFYSTTDSDGNQVLFPGDALQWWTKMYFTQNADGTLTLQNIELPGGTGYKEWQVNTDVLVVSYYDDHPNKAVFDDYKVGETFIIEGMTLDAIGGTGTDAELTATLKRVILCNHTSGWNPATCTSPATCKDCGAPKADSYPLGHNYDENDVQDCLTGINCTVCGYEKVAALGHTNGLGKWTYDSEAHWWTCTREGCPEADVKRNEAVHTFKNGKCSVCGYACEHPYGEGNFYEAVEPTCGVSGNIAYYECECGLKFTDANCTTPLTDVILPALEHEYDEETGICKNCGDELTATIVGSLEHAYPGKYYSDGTDGGYYTMVFADIGTAAHSIRGYASYTGDEGYSADAEFFPMPNSEGTGGDLAWWRKISFRKISTVDGKEYFVAQAICEPAKTVNGVTEYDLDYLEDLSSLSAEEKANHPWYVDEDVMVVAMGLHDDYIDEFSALEIGDVVYISGDNAYTFTELGSLGADTIIPEQGKDTFLTLHRHKWTAATCETPRMCKECGEVDSSSSAYGHTPGAEATCTTAQICTNCKATLVPALGHDFSSYVSNNNATCTANGTETATCGRGCGATDTREVADSKLGHSFVNYVSNNNATCTANGTESATCERGCGARDTRVVENSALGHSFTKYVFDNNATCNANGTETAECDNKCGASDTREVANSKFDHSFTNYIYNNDATCTEDGTETAKCDYYGCTATDTRTKANTALGHDPVSEWTYDSTYHWHECSRCEGYKDSQEEHTYVDRICSVCGKAQINPINLYLAYPDGSKYVSEKQYQSIWMFADTTNTTTGYYTICGFWQGTVDYMKDVIGETIHSTTETIYDTEEGVYKQAYNFPYASTVNGETVPHLSGWTFVSFDLIDGEWVVHRVDTTGTEYWTFAKDDDESNNNEWRVGLAVPTVDEDGNTTTVNRIAIAVPPYLLDESLEGNYSFVKYLEPGMSFAWESSGDYTYEKVGNLASNAPIDVTLSPVCVHSWIDATCTAPKTCKLCGKTEGTVLDHTAGAAATCTTAQVCTECGEVLVEALGHTWVDADCDTPKTCSVCYVTEGEKLGHNISTTLSSDDKTHWYACTRCDYKSEVELHIYVGLSDVCSTCGYVKDHTHTFGAKVEEQSATCTTTGMKEYYVCLGCTNWYADANGNVQYEGKENDSDIIISALGHSFTDYKSNNNATCTANGTETAKCDRCDVTNTREDDNSALGHTPGAEATCTTDQICIVCKEVIVEALGHKGGAEATCTTDQVCTECGIILVAAFGHKAGAEATCTTDQVCTECGEVLVGKLGHIYNNYVSNNNATCQNNCTETAVCERGCGETDTREIADTKVDHKYDNYVSNNNATCGVNGTKTAECIYGCGETDVVEDYGSALEHRYENYEFITNPTCTDTGLKTATCSNGCGTTQTVVVDALGHTEGPDATCTTDKICTVCGHVFEEAFGHNYEDQGNNTEKCTKCGDVQVLFTPVEIPLSHAGNDEYDSDHSWGVFVLAGSSYTSASSFSSLDWCQAALLEYDDVLGMFRVVEKSAPVDGAATTYKSWYYGSDRIIVYAFVDIDNAAAIANLKVDDYVELSGTTFDALKSADGYMGEGIAITTVDYHGVGDATAPQVLTPIIKEPKYNNFTVAYIPLDDRPVHTDRVALTAEAAGINLLMPQDNSMYETVLGADGHGGDPVRLLAWLREQEANGVDYYVIALDQIFSGGLVNSRYSDSSFNGQFTAQDKEIADFLVDLAKNNYVVYTDTIMRLASTYPYKEHTEVLYTMLRDYGKGENYYGTSSRIVLDENGTDKYNLTFEHVVSSYKFSKDGTTPIGRYYQVGSSYYNLEDGTLNGYLGARERKLRITDYMLRNAGGNINHYYIGMDDSAEGETIQKNEQRYIDMIIEQTGSNAITFAGADEMSVMGISAMTNLLVDASENEQIPAANGWEISKVPVNVVYFSEAAKNWQADEYDSGNLGPAIDRHLKALDAYQVADEYKLDKRVIQLVVVARGTEQYSFSSDGSAAETQITLSRQNAANAADYIDAQLENNRPVAIIDVSYWNACHLNFVAEAMRNRGIFDRDDFNEILGYSTWNTAGNAIGLGMGQAFARYNYIMNTDVVSRSSNLGFIKLLAYSFVKDAAYRTNSFINWTMDTSSAKTYTCGTYSYTTAGFTGNEFLGYINNSTKMLLKGGVSGDYDYNHNVSIHTPIWPANWGPRSFECWFTVEATSDEPETGDKFAGGGVVLPDEDFE